MFNLKLAFRTLFKSPFVTIVAIISLALGIGANAAIFSLFNQMLLRPLPVQEPDAAGQPERPRARSRARSRAATPATATRSSATRCSATSSARRPVFTGIAAHVVFGANLAYQGQTLSGSGMLVSGSYFPVLGVQPALGRLLGSDDDQRDRRIAGRGAEPRLLADALRRRPERAQPDAHRQRPAPDHRRRRAARVRGHDARRRDRRCSCRSRCARRWARAARRSSTIAAATGRTSSRG